MCVLYIKEFELIWGMDEVVLVSIFIEYLVKLSNGVFILLLSFCF